MRRFELSVTQVIASALAAVTATIAASYLGVTGTVIGAAIASVVTAVSSAVFGHSLRSTRARVREAASRSWWRAAALGSVAMFAGVLVVITGIEFVAGRPISDVVRGDSGSGTSLFGGGRASNSDPHHPTPTITTTVTPSVVVTTPTVTQTAPTVTETHTPTVTQTPTSSPTPTPTTAAPATSTTSSAAPVATASQPG